MEFVRNVQQFFRDVAAEFRRVNWPSRSEVASSTVVVLAVVFVLAIYLWGVDVLLSWPVEKLFKFGGKG